ncbi:Ig-like domain-containing protein [Methanobrevibacter filiformis]|uniref:Bacterial Ig-like domain protein n=1 Tax=Methanobrevibacter filiformis TaxID=55758 RepID=A0A166DAX6_9EURY|nr:Ig-like domain-containing protein [Methanobrevibacter filiformis]KZX15393.1 bacterial Ig-like domain protein [Methanobrevibacter filiformis]
MIKKIFIFILLITLISISLGGVNASGTEYINDATIEGINGAIGDINDYDTIYLEPGTYFGKNNTNIIINKTITLIGNTNNSTKVIIDGEGTNQLFKVTSSGNLTLINMTLANGFVDGNGGAIYNEGDLAVSNSNFVNNVATNLGGGIFTLGNSSILSSNFTNNTEAIYINGNDNSVLSSNILNNLKGITISNAANGTIINYNRLFNNTALGYDLNNGGNNTNANLNWWGANSIASNQIKNTGENFDNQYWFVLQLSSNDKNYHVNTTEYYTKLTTYTLTYNISTNLPTAYDRLKLALFNVTVICPFNNVWSRYSNDITPQKGSFQLANMTASKYNLDYHMPFGDFNVNGTNVFTMKAFVDNEYLVLNLNYISSNLSVGYSDNNSGETVELIANLTTVSGTPIYNKYVEFWIENVYVGTNKTDQFGIARLQYKPTINGSFNVKAIFEEDGSYGESDDSTLVVLSSLNTRESQNKTQLSILKVKNVVYGELTVLKANLTNENGKAIPSKTISFYVNNKLVGTNKTNSKGIAIYKYKVKKTGTLKIKATFAGNANYIKSTDEDKLTVPKLAIIKLKNNIKKGKGKTVKLHTILYNIGPDKSSFKIPIKVTKGLTVTKVWYKNKKMKATFNKKTKTINWTIKKLGITKKHTTCVIVTFKTDRKGKYSIEPIVKKVKGLVVSSNNKVTFKV